LHHLVDLMTLHHLASVFTMLARQRAVYEQFYNRKYYGWYWCLFNVSAA